MNNIHLYLHGSFMDLSLNQVDSVSPSAYKPIESAAFINVIVESLKSN